MAQNNHIHGPAHPLHELGSEAELAHLRQLLLYRDVDVGVCVKDAWVGEGPKKDHLPASYQLRQSHLETLSGLTVQVQALATTLGVLFLKEM